MLARNCPVKSAVWARSPQREGITVNFKQWFEKTRDEIGLDFAVIEAAAALKYLTRFRGQVTAVALIADNVAFGWSEQDVIQMVGESPVLGMSIENAPRTQFERPCIRMRATAITSAAFWAYLGVSAPPPAP